MWFGSGLKPGDENMSKKIFALVLVVSAVVAALLVNPDAPKTTEPANAQAQGPRAKNVDPLSCSNKDNLSTIAKLTVGTISWNVTQNLYPGWSVPHEDQEAAIQFKDIGAEGQIGNSIICSATMYADGGPILVKYSAEIDKIIADSDMGLATQYQKQADKDLRDAQENKEFIRMNPNNLHIDNFQLAEQHLRSSAAKNQSLADSNRTSTGITDQSVI
jgi:hypothetical protein